MIWLWIRGFIESVVWLLVPPAAPPPKKINVNETCPNCGHGKGKLSVAQNNGKPACQHTCLICGAMFYEDPVMQQQAVSGASGRIALPETAPSTAAATAAAAPTPAR